MSPRPLSVDPYYALLAGVVAVIVAALTVVGAIYASSDIDDGTPPPTTYLVGPDGDAVEIVP